MHKRAPPKPPTPPPIRPESVVALSEFPIKHEKCWTRDAMDADAIRNVGKELGNNNPDVMDELNSSLIQRWRLEESVTWKTRAETFLKSVEASKFDDIKKDLIPLITALIGEIEACGTRQRCISHIHNVRQYIVMYQQQKLSSISQERVSAIKDIIIKDDLRRLNVREDIPFDLLKLMSTDMLSHYMREKPAMVRKGYINFIFTNWTFDPLKLSQQLGVFKLEEIAEMTSTMRDYVALFASQALPEIMTKLLKTPKFKGDVLQF